MADYHEATILYLQSPDGVKPEVQKNQFPLKKWPRAQGELGVPPRVPTLGKMKVSQPRMTRIFTDKRGWIQGFLTSVGILRLWQPLSRRFTGSSSVQVIHADMPALRGVGNAAGKVIARRVARVEFGGMRRLPGGRDQGWDGIRKGIKAVCRFRPSFRRGAGNSTRRRVRSPWTGRRCIGTNPDGLGLTGGGVEDTKGLPGATGERCGDGPGRWR